MPSTMPLTTVAVGLGHQNSGDHIPAIVESDDFELVAVPHRSYLSVIKTLASLLSGDRRESHALVGIQSA